MMVLYYAVCGFSLGPETCRWWLFLARAVKVFRLTGVQESKLYLYSRRFDMKHCICNHVLLTTEDGCESRRFTPPGLHQILIASSAPD